MTRTDTYLMMIITEIGITFGSYLYCIKRRSSFSKACVEQLTCIWSCFNFNTSGCRYIYRSKTRVKFRGHIGQMVFKVSLANMFKSERQSLWAFLLVLVSHLPLSLLAGSVAKANPSPGRIVRITGVLVDSCPREGGRRQIERWPSNHEVSELESQSSHLLIYFILFTFHFKFQN